MKLITVLSLLLLQTTASTERFKRELQKTPDVLLSSHGAITSALIVELHCKKTPDAEWTPCEDAKNLNPDEKGDLTVVFMGELSDGTQFRIAPIRRDYQYGQKPSPEDVSK